MKPMNEEEAKKNVDQMAEEAKQFQDHLQEAAEQTDDVKEGRCTAEDERNEPAFKLYNSIAESTVKIIENDVVHAGLMVIGQELGENILKSIVSILTVSMTYSAHQAIVLYDELLKEELQKHFNALGESVNSAGALIRAHEGVLKVMQKRIQDIENNYRKKETGA